MNRFCIGKGKVESRLLLDMQRGRSRGKSVTAAEMRHVAHLSGEWVQGWLKEAMDAKPVAPNERVVNELMDRIARLTVLRNALKVWEQKRALAKPGPVVQDLSEGIE